MIQETSDEPGMEGFKLTQPCTRLLFPASKKLGNLLEQPRSYSTVLAVPGADAVAVGLHAPDASAAAHPIHPETAAPASDQPNSDLCGKDFHFSKP